MYLLVRVRYTAVFVQEILICCLRLLKIYGEGGWGDTNPLRAILWGIGEGMVAALLATSTQWICLYFVQFVLACKRPSYVVLTL